MTLNMISTDSPTVLAGQERSIFLLQPSKCQASLWFLCLHHQQETPMQSRTRHTHSGTFLGSYSLLPWSLCIPSWMWSPAHPFQLCFSMTWSSWWSECSIWLEWFSAWVLIADQAVHLESPLLSPHAFRPSCASTSCLLATTMKPGQDSHLGFNVFSFSSSHCPLDPKFFRCSWIQQRTLRIGYQRLYRLGIQKLGLDLQGGGT